MVIALNAPAFSVLALPPRKAHLALALLRQVSGPLTPAHPEAAAALKRGKRVPQTQPT